MLRHSVRQRTDTLFIVMSSSVARHHGRIQQRRGPIPAEAEAVLAEVIKLFSRWKTLQMAVDNQWGCRDSRAGADQFGESILSWFCRSKGTYSSFSILR